MAKKRKARKHLPKVRGNPGQLGNQPNQFGVWYGARPWGGGDRTQSDQAAAVKVVGRIVAGVVLVIVAIGLVVALIAG